MVDGSLNCPVFPDLKMPGPSTVVTEQSGGTCDFVFPAPGLSQELEETWTSDLSPSLFSHPGGLVALLVVSGSYIVWPLFNL